LHLQSRSLNSLMGSHTWYVMMSSDNYYASVTGEGLATTPTNHSAP
jgi:hypothetical protein